MRLKRDHKPSSKDSKVKGTSAAKGGTTDVIKNLCAMHRQDSQFAKQMGENGANDDDTDSSTRSDYVANDKEKKASNRTHPSSTRQKRVSVQESK